MKYAGSVQVGGAGRSIKSFDSCAAKFKRIDSKFNNILNPIPYGLAWGFLLLKSLNHASESTFISQGWNEFEIFEIHRCAFQPALVFIRFVGPAPRGADSPFAEYPVRT